MVKDDTKDEVAANASTPSTGNKLKQLLSSLVSPSATQNEKTGVQPVAIPVPALPAVQQTPQATPPVVVIPNSVDANRARGEAPIGAVGAGQIRNAAVPVGVAGAAGQDTPAPSKGYTMQQGTAGMAGTEPATRTNNASDAVPVAAPVQAIPGTGAEAPPPIPQEPTPPPPPQQTNPQASAAGAKMGQQQAATYDPGTAPVAPDPLKAASATPGFWTNLLKVAASTGRTVLELIGDFAAGYSHQQSSPTEQRLQREHELRMQGNQLQYGRDIASMQQGFQQRQAALDRQMEADLANAKNEIEKDQIRKNYEIQKQQVEIERRRAENELAIWTLGRQYSPQAIYNPDTFNW